eukprot:300037-Amphidinium_carterae.2
MVNAKTVMQRGLTPYSCHSTHGGDGRAKSGSVDASQERCTPEDTRTQGRGGGSEGELSIKMDSKCGQDTDCLDEGQQQNCITSRSPCSNDLRPNMDPDAINGMQRAKSWRKCSACVHQHLAT